MVGAPTGAVDRSSSCLALRVCVDDFQGVAPELHGIVDEAGRLLRSASSHDDYGAGVEDPGDYALLDRQSFDTVMVQFEGRCV